MNATHRFTSAAWYSENSFTPSPVGSKPMARNLSWMSGCLTISATASSLVKYGPAFVYYSLRNADEGACGLLAWLRDVRRQQLMCFISEARLHQLTTHANTIVAANSLSGTVSAGSHRRDPSE